MQAGPGQSTLSARIKRYPGWAVGAGMLAFSPAAVMNQHYPNVVLIMSAFTGSSVSVMASNEASVREQCYSTWPVESRHLSHGILKTSPVSVNTGKVYRRWSRCHGRPISSARSF